MDLPTLSKLSPLSIAMMCFTASSLANDEPGSLHEVEKILVTGTKIERTIQETPVSVNVTTAENIQERGLIGMYDVLVQVPNVAVGNESDFSVRGINAFGASQSITGGGTNNALASLYLDGAAMPYRIIQQGTLTAWDIAQVEVFRGPQSTLQGRNALAGAVVMTTVNPTYDWGAKVRANIGSDGLREYAFAGGGALIEDELAIRLAGEKNDRDGYNTAPNIAGNSDYSEADNWRLKVLYEPLNLDGFSAMFAYSNMQSDNGVSFVNVPSEPEKRYSERIMDYNAPTHEFTDTDFFNLTLNYEINDNWSVTSVTALTKAEYGYEWDSDASPLALAQQFDTRNDDTFSQEIRFVFDYDNVDGVIGAFYSDLDSKDNYNGNQLLPFSSLGIDQLLTSTLITQFGMDEATAIGTTAYVMGVYADSGADPADLALNGEYQQTITTAALFADMEYHFNETISLLFGVRIDDEEQSFSNDDNYAISSAFPDPTQYDPTTGMIISLLNTQIQGMAAQASTSIPESSGSFTEVLPKAGVKYNVNDDLTYSFVYQKGYRSGGVGYNIIRGERYSYGAEFTDNYEFSVRSTWLDNALTVNGNVFYIDWTDQQLTVALSAANNDSIVVNAGRSEVMGFEIETQYVVSENLSFYAGFGLSETEFKEYSSNGNTYDGRPFAGAPKVTANMGLNYTAESGFVANANINYNDSSIAELKPNGADDVIEPENDARTLVDVRIGYEWRNESQFGIYLVAQNLLDEEYRSAAATLTNPATHTLGDPRQVSLEFRGSF